MTRDEVQSRIVTFLRKIAPDADASTLDPNEDFRDALDVDSVDVLNLLTAVHDGLGVEIPDRDQNKVVTLKSLTDYVFARNPTPK